MLKNYFLIALRNLIKNPVYSLINIVGLAIGIICFTLILLWVNDETSYNKFLPKYDKLYQVWVNAEYSGKVNSWTSVPLPTYEAMKEADPDIVRSAVSDWGYAHLLNYEEKKITREGLYVSEEFLEMFEFPLIKGDPTTVLDDLKSIVITESLAEMLFGDDDPIDKIIKVDNESDLRVTGLLKDIPKNSSFPVEFFIPWKLREQTNPWIVENMDNWGNYSFQVYVELTDEARHAQVQENVKDMLTENGQDDIPREFFLHPLKMWRLHSSFENGQLKGGRGDYVQLFSAIAILVVCIWGNHCSTFVALASPPRVSMNIVMVSEWESNANRTKLHTIRTNKTLHVTIE